MRYENNVKKCEFLRFYYQHFGRLKRLLYSNGEYVYIEAKFMAGAAAMEVVL